MIAMCREIGHFFGITLNGIFVIDSQLTTDDGDGGKDSSEREIEREGECSSRYETLSWV